MCAANRKGPKTRPNLAVSNCPFGYVSEYLDSAASSITPPKMTFGWVSEAIGGKKKIEVFEVLETRPTL
jgi:hypothetical protein